jgi:hypothetical protein
LNAHCILKSLFSSEYISETGPNQAKDKASHAG